MHLAAVKRADGPPEFLHLGTTEGIILRFALNISGAKICSTAKVMKSRVNLLFDIDIYIMLTSTD